MKRIILFILLAILLSLDTSAIAEHGVDSRRIAGENRYETSVAISQYQYPNGANTVYLANGQTLVDALAINPKNGPVLLVSRDSVSDAVLAEVTRLDPNMLIFLGGPVSISSSVKHKVENAANNSDPEMYMLGLINNERSSYPLNRASDIDSVALNWSINMEEERRFYHNDNFSKEYCCHKKAAENIAYTSHHSGSINSAVDRLHKSLMDSEPHRKNLLDSDFDDIGIGIVTGDCPSTTSASNCIWVTQNFRDRV